MWYSGVKSDIWIEWKWLAKIPTRTTVVIRPALSALQVDWLVARKKEGRNVFVVVGCPDGCVLYASPEEWKDGITVKEFRARLSSKLEIANWITEYTMGHNVQHRQKSSASSAGDGVGI